MLFYRILTFSWAKAVMFVHIVRELNVLFERLQIDATISYSGLPSPEDILIVRSRMLAGELNFSDAVAAAKY